MSGVMYGLCATTALVCALLLLRAYRLSHSPVLWWSGLCFCGLFVANVLLVLDKLFVPTIDLEPARLGVTLASMILLVYGLVYRSE